MHQLELIFALPFAVALPLCSAYSTYTSIVQAPCTAIVLLRLLPVEATGGTAPTWVVHHPNLGPALFERTADVCCLLTHSSPGLPSTFLQARGCPLCRQPHPTSQHYD